MRKIYCYLIVFTIMALMALLVPLAYADEVVPLDPQYRQHWEPTSDGGQRLKKGSLGADAINQNGVPVMVALPSSHIHADSTARDAYWDGDPDTPEDGDYCSTTDNGYLYRHNGTSWVHVGTLSQGPKGDTGAAGADGADGSDGDPIAWQGAWDSGTNYYDLDAVSYQGSSYICKTTGPVIGTNPASDTTNWDLLASKGDTGDAGATGADGADGQDGTNGIVSAWVTAHAYTANDLVANDGVIYKCDTGHTSGSTTEPGTGASWATYWTDTTASGSGDLVSTNNLSDVANAATAYGNIKQEATTSATGAVELATTTEASAGTDSTRAVTPAGLQDYMDTHALSPTGTTGILTKTATDPATAAYRSIDDSDDGFITWTNPAGVAGNPKPDFTWDFDFADITSKPTTMAGYGITDDDDVPDANEVTASAIVDWYAYDEIPIAWMQDGTSAPAALDDASTRSPFVYRDFDSTADEDLDFVWFVPADLSGTTIQYRVKYLITNATGPSATEGVAFGLSGISAGDNDATNGTKGTVVVVTDDTLNAVQHDIMITGWSGDVTVTNLAPGEVAEMALIRDVSDAVDDYGQDVGVLSVEIRYVQNVAR